MSVEFVSHLTRSFAVSTKPTRLERAKDATVSMGSAVSVLHPVLYLTICVPPDSNYDTPTPARCLLE